MRLLWVQRWTVVCHSETPWVHTSHRRVCIVELLYHVAFPHAVLYLINLLPVCSMLHLLSMYTYV